MVSQNWKYVAFFSFFFLFLFSFAFAFLCLEKPSLGLIDPWELRYEVKDASSDHGSRLGGKGVVLVTSYI